MFTAPMTQVLALVLEKDSKKVTEAILGQGVMQLVSISEFETAGLKDMSTARSEEALTEVTEMRKRVEGMLDAAGVAPLAPKESDLEKRAAVDIPKEKAHLDKIDGEREAIRERQLGLQQEILKLEDVRRQAQIYGTGLAGLRFPAKQSVISMQTGKLPVSSVRQLDEGLRGLPALSVPLGREDSTEHLVVVSMRRDSEQINRILADVGWARTELPGGLTAEDKNLMEEIDSKVRKLTEEQRRLQSQARELVRREEKWLKGLWVSLRINELCYRIETNFKLSSRTVIFAGWLPTGKKEKLARRIREVCHGRCVMEFYDAGSREAIGQDVPVELTNPKAMEPFEMLVSNFGIPQYGTVDPTPFVMPIYLTMFGLMFADAGQGLVLTAAGALGAWFFKGQKDRRNWERISWLVIWCGLSAVLFGVLFGSYFGYQILPPVWFDFHGIVSGHGTERSVIGNIYDILSITLYFGIGVIGLGLAFNWINLIRTGQFGELLFDKGGVFAAWMYAGGIYIGFYMVEHNYKGFPAGPRLFLLVGLPALLLLLKEPWHFFKGGGEHGEARRFNPLVTPLSWLMQWVVELLEIFSGYLSNTLSFMRVAGLGIAHASLMIAFFTLAAMTSGVGSAAILLAGNMLVIVLESLSAGIQALRLNYYEFFTKFFHGTGKLYTPISLESKF